MPARSCRARLSPWFREDIKEAMAIPKPGTLPRALPLTLHLHAQLPGPRTTARSWADLPACAPESWPLPSGSRPTACSPASCAAPFKPSPAPLRAFTACPLLTPRFLAARVSSHPPRPIIHLPRPHPPPYPLYSSHHTPVLS